MNEADRALIGVGDVHLRREYTPICRKPSASGDACPSAKSTGRLLPYHPAAEQSRSTDGDLTVDVRYRAPPPAPR